jgi:hypothetical protein
MNQVLRLFANIFLACSVGASSLRAAEPASPGSPAAESPASGEKLEAENSQKRLDFLTTAAARFELQVTTNQGTEQGRLTEKPLLRWTNPHSSAKDGVLVAYGRGGRPDALAQFAIYSETNVVHEFQTTSEKPLKMSRDGRVFWIAEEPVINFRTLEAAAAPAGSEALRTAQMRQIAESFQVFDEHGWTNPVRQPLRLLRQPTYRYRDSQAGIIDGAVFTYALATDPEANLLLEAFQGESGPQWRFAFSEMTIYALQALRNDELVWDKPDRRVFCRANVAHYVCPYRPAADDLSLKGILPMASSNPNKQ